MKETINQRINRLRKNSGYTQADMAKILGIHITSYSRLERKGNINCQLLIKFAEIFKTDISTILYGESETQQKETPTTPPTNTRGIDFPPFYAIDRYEKGTIIAMRSVSSESKCEIFTYAINKLEEENEKLMQNNT